MPDNAAFLFRNGTCKIAIPAEKSQLQYVRYFLNDIEQQKLFLTKNASVMTITLPFSVESIVSSFHDFICLLKDGIFKQCALIWRPIVDEWVLMVVDAVMDDVKIKLVSCNLQRQCFAVSEDNDVYFWESYWKQDPNCSQLVQLVPS